MIGMIKKRFAFVAAMVGLLVSAQMFAFAQKTGETVSRVPALEEFHEVIHAIWHEAWPNKDTVMMRKLLPEVDRGIAAVATAPLPGILRHKKDAWEAGVRALQSLGVEYKKAAEAGDDARLLAAAEALHRGFRELRRVIQPAFPELDEFHAVLYVLYHHYMPVGDLENIRKSAAELTQKMTVLDRVKLAERWADKDSDFQTARRMLSQSVSALRDAVQANDMRAIRDAVESVHDRYQSLQRLF